MQSWNFLWKNGFLMAIILWKIRGYNVSLAEGLEVLLMAS
jgi:hypothetical protein